MKRYKATGLVFIREYIKKRSDLDEQWLLGQLTEAQAKEYLLAVTNQWVLLSTVEKVFELAAEIIFPQDEKGIEKISSMHARYSIRGVYKLFFRLLTPAFVISQTTRMWNAYNDHGKAYYLLDEKNRQAMMIVEGVPEMSVIRKKMLTGFIKGVISLTNATNYQLELNESNPEQWRWEGRWEA